MKEQTRVEVFTKDKYSINSIYKENLETKLETKLKALYQSSAFSIISKKSLHPDLIKKVLTDEITEDFFIDENHRDLDYIAQISFSHGVTDNLAQACTQAFELFDEKIEVRSHRLFEFSLKEKKNKKDIERAFAHEFYNPLIEDIKIFEKNEPRFNHNKKYESNKLEGQWRLYQEYDLGQEDDVLMEIVQENCLALNLDEIKSIQSYYNDEKIQEDRKKQGLPFGATDVELEVIAQTWSEHCKHKIFNAHIDYKETEFDGIKLGDRKIKSVFKEYIKAVTDKNDKDWLESVFVDNSGIISLDENLCVCMKVETHNSPSALDPYGGAITGILGVNRDILGTGLGAKPIANTNVFCFGPPNFPQKAEEKYFPKNLLRPKKILEGVHRGVVDGGNKSGIPTINGAFHFDIDYSAKPLVYVGTIGIMPKTLRSGRVATSGDPVPGDLIVMVGGAIGADGIHGATFSSKELDESSPSSAVQIGDPFTQKKVLDFILAARDGELISAITDNGAGGLSSSVGEMAELAGGARLDLSLAKTKYPGLRPFELMISESQERMTVAIKDENKKSFLELAKTFEVDCSVLGEFNNSGRLSVFFKKDLVADLELNFLHGGLPQMNLEASWSGPHKRSTWDEFTPDLSAKRKVVFNKSFQDSLSFVLSSPNVCSKESYVRQYDHEVMGQTAVKPYSGENGHIPSDSGAVWLGRHSSNKKLALVTGCGLAPKISLEDPFLMAQFATDEAVRNMVCQGGDIEHMALLDNFCWPDPVETSKNPGGKRKLGALVRSCAGLKEVCDAYKLPLISGKDSMKNDYVSSHKKGLKISVLPTLLVSGLAKASIDHLVPSSFQQNGDLIYLLGETGEGLKYSEFDQIFKHCNEEQNRVPKINLNKNFSLYKLLGELLKQNLLSSCHDISEGGLLSALFESSIEFGANIEVKTTNLLNYFYNEGPGQILVSVNEKNEKKLLSYLQEISYTKLGEVKSSGEILVKNHKENYSWKIKNLMTHYQGTLLC